MSLLSFFGLTSLSPNPTDDFWYGPVGRQTAAGVRVDEQVAMTYSACRASTMLIATSGGMVPLKLLTKLGSGGSSTVSDDPRYGMVHDTPNPDMTSFMYRCLGFNQQVNRGNFYSEIERNRGGMAVALHPIHATRIPRENVKRAPDGKVFYRVRNDNGSSTDIKSADMLHVPSWLSEDGIVGRGVVEDARLSIGFGIATEQHGAAYFGNGAKPGVIIEGGNFKNQQDREEYRRQWVEVHGGPTKNNAPTVLPTGAKVTTLSFNANDSQFLETRQHNVEEVARWYGVPPHLIGHLLRSTNNNITQQALEFVKYSLMRWLVSWEQELNRKLLSVDERKTMFFKFIVEGLERADITTRTQALHQQWMDGALTLNQWMALEDRNPIGPVGDIHWVQQAMIPVEFAANGPQPAQPPKEEPEPDDDDTEVDDEGELSARVLAQDATIAALRAEADAAKAVQKQLAAAMLRDVMSRMVSLEVNAVKRVAEKPSRFDARLREFYDKHKATLARELDAPLSVWAAASGASEASAVTLAERHVTESLRQLDALCDCQAEELSAKVEACLAEWHGTRTVLTLETKPCN